MTVQDFCKRFSAALREDFWGDIDPYIFDHLAEPLDAEELAEMDGEIVSAIKGMEEILTKVLREA